MSVGLSHHVLSALASQLRAVWQAHYALLDCIQEGRPFSWTKVEQTRQRRAEDGYYWS